MNILFLHGWQSTPGGLKPTYLKDHGHEVLNPHLPDDDFDAAVRIAQAEYDQHKPDVVVGSSRGGAVAMNIDSGDTPVVLLCPAWQTWGTATKVKPNTTILHSRSDETVPFADSEELVRNSGLPMDSLIEVGFEHRLADEESLGTMLRAAEGIKIRQELPVWIERSLMRGFYSCSEPEYVQFRQDSLRESVLEITDAHENGRNLLHDTCIEHLGDPNDDIVRNALSCLFVLGTTADVASVEPLLQHPTEAIRKAARTCLFEVKRRPEED
jgi:Alpha/beta hydrolase family